MPEQLEADREIRQLQPLIENIAQEIDPPTDLAVFQFQLEIEETADPFAYPPQGGWDNAYRAALRLIGILDHMPNSVVARAKAAIARAAQKINSFSDRRPFYAGGMMVVAYPLVAGAIESGGPRRPPI